VAALRAERDYHQARADREQRESLEHARIAHAGLDKSIAERDALKAEVERLRPKAELYRRKAEALCDEVRREEREACAVLATRFARDWEGTVAAIRARGVSPPAPEANSKPLARWQCFGCSTRFESYRKLCPVCGKREYFCGSVNQSLGLFMSDADIARKEKRAPAEVAERYIAAHDALLDAAESVRALGGKP